ncbi:MAG: aryldialkylphosphatase [Streptosporangiales bacterium]|nr:aryldialkylphosphatase [Streptosporangiales bacterium]
MPSAHTVLGPVPGDDLGAVDAHEHLFLRSPALPGDEFEDLERMTAEAAAVRASGIDTVVDLTPVGLGRDPRKLAELCRRTGLRVILATGYHREAHYPAGHWARRLGADELLDVVLTDLTQGVDERDWQGPRPVLSEVRAGIVKLGASYQVITDAERRWFAAGAEAAQRTGVPVAVHCEIGTAAHEVLDLLGELGVPARRVILAHMDRNPDVELHGQLAERGATLVYDTVGRVKYRPESVLVNLIGRIVDAGHIDRLMLGTDVGRRSMIRAYGGGPGMDVLGREFLPRLTRRIGEERVAHIMRTNPARTLVREAVPNSPSRAASRD